MAIKLVIVIVLICALCTRSYVVDLDEATQSQIADIVRVARESSGKESESVDDLVRKYEMMKAALQSIVDRDQKLSEKVNVQTILASVSPDGTSETLTSSSDANAEVNVAVQTDATAPSVVASGLPKSCESFMDCNSCVVNRCAWCVMGRKCRPDRAWECQGEHDHVGLGGVGTHQVCPSLEEEDRKRAERKRRKAEAAQKLEEEIAKHKSLLKEKEQAEASNKPESGENRKEKEPFDKIERWNELKRRSNLALEGYGAKHPYETLEIPNTASSADIKKAYRKLSVAFHPDKNTGTEESEMALHAFKDISAAYELLSDPEKRAMFDDIGSDEKHESFDTQEAYERYGRANKDNFYQGHKHITPLTESLWERRVGSGDEVWLVEFYAPWCSACQNLLPVYKMVADELAEDAGIEVGAVNCVTQPNICQDWFAISAYPTLIACNDKHGTRQEYHGSKDKDSITTWIRAVTREWRWLFATSNLIDIRNETHFKETVLNSTQFWVIAYMDGVDCSACKTAKTNAMRLSASLRGFDDVRVGIVNCEEEETKSLCYASQGLPNRPHAPVVKAYPSGAKPDNSRGEVLYNANELEPHIALEILDHTLRLALADRVTAGTVGVANGFDGFAAEEKEKEKEKPQPPPQPMWNGPARREPLPWNQGGAGGPVRRHAIGG